MMFVKNISYGLVRVNVRSQWVEESVKVEKLGAGSIDLLSIVPYPWQSLRQNKDSH